MHDATTQYIIENNKFKKEIEDLKSEIQGLNEKNTKLKEKNFHQYNSYEEQILDLT